MDPKDYLFSPDALAVLDSLPYDPEAKGRYEWLSGGLMWPDEFPWGDDRGTTVVRQNDAFKFLIAARARITLGEAHTGYRAVWEQVVRGAPNWPGLRSERRGEAARKKLLAADRILKRCLDKLERSVESGGSEPRDSG